MVIAQSFEVLPTKFDYSYSCNLFVIRPSLISWINRYLIKWNGFKLVFSHFGKKFTIVV
jgi:hypothetical protein